MRPVDADALKVHICDMCDDGQRECKGDESCAILCWVNDMPTIEPEVQHGQWIELPKALNPEETPCQCSVCKHILSFYYTTHKSNFCPNCGTRMDTIDTSVNRKGELK